MGVSALDIGLIALVAAALLAGSAPSHRLRFGAALCAGGLGVGLLVRLGWALVAEDWSYALVVDQTRPDLAWPLRAAGLWAGPEGSLLLWTVMLALALSAVVRRTSDRVGPALLGGLTAAYGTTVAVVANPFERLSAPPSAGLGLQPVLEHEAMTWHPPILYAGMIAAASAAALGLGGATVVHRRRAWLLACGLLTVGLATGARWAHVELGWGGYWAWDPVENAGLIVWLLSAAAVHRPRSTPIAALTLMAVVWGTTLTRIGVVASVHAFADDEPLRLALLGIAVFVTATMALFMALFMVRLRRVTTQLPTSSRSQSALMLTIAAMVVAVGTFEPAVEALFGGDTAAIAGTYYTRLLWPLVMVAAALCLASDRQPIKAGVGALAGVLLSGAGAGVFGMVVGAAGGAIAGSALALRGRPGRLAHVGLGVFLIGVAATFGTQRASVTLAVDAPVDIGGVVAVHRSIDLRPGTARSEAVARIEVDGHALEPSIVAYHTRSRRTSEMDEYHPWASIGGTRQVIFVDGDAERATYQLYWHPRIGLLWLGAALVALGSAVAFVSQQLVERGSTVVDRV